MAPTTKVSATTDDCLHQVTHGVQVTSVLTAKDRALAQTVLMRSLRLQAGQPLDLAAIEEILPQLISNRVRQIEHRVLRCQLDGVAREKVERDLTSRGLRPATAGDLFSVFCRGTISGLAGTQVHALGQELVIGEWKYYLTVIFPLKPGSTGLERNPGHPKPILGLTEVTELGVKSWGKTDRFLAVVALPKSRAR
ncbi:MAG: hypothetical protein NTV81_04735 [Candidatus Komeilibacteria bacterium]|nr:hypothetical protein [Candidatus Komeilibacteria bacterium]